MVEYLLGVVCIVGVVFTAYFVYKKLKSSNKDGDPEGLDLLTSWHWSILEYICSFICSFFDIA